MRTMIRAGLVTLALLASIPTQAADDALPPSLRDWQGWVMHGQDFRRCPFAVSDDQEPGEPIDEGYYRCIWPERLTLAVDSRGGTFSQRKEVFAPLAALGAQQVGDRQLDSIVYRTLLFGRRVDVEDEKPERPRQRRVPWDVQYLPEEKSVDGRRGWIAVSWGEGPLAGITHMVRLPAGPRASWRSAAGCGRCSP